MRNPRDIQKPLALGAPRPPAEIPVRPSRMIHFFDPSNERMASKVPELLKKVDVLLANLEDAIEARNK
ncbi:MAG: CoA ester lyase, partial [Candidatus Rokubacteria bacterium]|nr:CoA ester lyase [Candidatus Rokubacteria bacterium]